MAWWPWSHQGLIRGPQTPGSTGYFPNHAVFHRPDQLLREMRVVVDAELSDRRSDEEFSYLLQLLAVEPIHAYFFSDSGRPPTEEELGSTTSAIPAVKEWVITHAGNAGEQANAVYWKGDSRTTMPLPERDSIARALAQSIASAHLPNPAAPESVQHDAMALSVARAIRADLFITERRTILGRRGAVLGDVTPLTPNDAIPVVGLYLRQQQKYVLARVPELGSFATPTSLVESGRGSFYWEAARTLLPSFGWLEAVCSNSSSATYGEMLPALPAALRWRLDQILRSRDRLLVILSVAPISHEPADDALTELELILMWLMATFDITARVAHITLGMRGRHNRAAWHRRGGRSWLEEVRGQSPNLAAPVVDGSEGANLLDVVSSLRNSIHEEPISSSGIVPVIGDFALNLMMRLPSVEQQEVLTAIERLGGHDLWGLRPPFVDSELHLHPGVFVEQLLPRSLQLLEKLIENLPSGPKIGVADESARFERLYPVSRFDYRRLWQLGVSRPRLE